MYELNPAELFLSDCSGQISHTNIARFRVSPERKDNGLSFIEIAVSCECLIPAAVGESFAIWDKHHRSKAFEFVADYVDHDHLKSSTEIAGRVFID